MKNRENIFFFLLDALECFRVLRIAIVVEVVGKSTIYGALIEISLSKLFIVTFSRSFRLFH